MPRLDGAFEVINKIGPNTYKRELPTKHGVSPTFNVVDLCACHDEDDKFLSLRSNSRQAKRRMLGTIPLLAIQQV